MSSSSGKLNHAHRKQFWWYLQWLVTLKIFLEERIGPLGLETFLSFSLQAGNEAGAVEVLRGDRVYENSLMKIPVTHFALCLAPDLTSGSSCWVRCKHHWLVNSLGLESPLSSRQKWEIRILRCEGRSCTIHFWVCFIRIRWRLLTFRILPRGFGSPSVYLVKMALEMTSEDGVQRCTV